jgi:hypothetical protein
MNFAVVFSVQVKRRIYQNRRRAIVKGYKHPVFRGVAARVF